MSARLRRVAAGVVAVGVLAGGLVACSDEQAPTAPSATDAPMPDLELPLLGGGGSRNLATFERPTLVNVWATWCTPCRTEMPVIEEFAQAHAGVVDVLGINFQDPQVDAAVEFVRETGVTYPSVRDADGEIDRLTPFPQLRGLPFMAVVDADGRMVGSEFSVAQDVSDLEELVERHLPGVLDGADDATEGSE